MIDDVSKRISASRMKTFMSCPLQAKFQYVDKLPRPQMASASFGSCVHYALKLYNDTHGDLEKALEAFREVWDAPETIGVEPTKWPKGVTYGSLRDRGFRILNDYHSKLRWEKRQVVATEHRFLVPFGDYELTGAVDLIEIRKDSRGRESLRIVDYKTNTQQPRMNQLHLDVQFTAYVYAAMQPEFWTGYPGTDFEPVVNGEAVFRQFGKRVPRAIWYHLENTREFDAGLKDDQDFMRLYRCCSEISKAVKHEVFVPNISGDSCVFCPYTVECGLPIKKVEEDQ